MMMNQTLILSALILVSCRQIDTKENFQRIVFDSTDLIVVSSSVNKKLETMSLLYSGRDLSQGANSDKVYKFVTWRYSEHPYYIGSTINGELLSTETINVYESGNTVYSIDEGVPFPVNGKLLTEEERVQYILGHTPFSLP